LRKRQARIECPVSHLQELIRVIPDISQILTIGWRGTEQHFLDLLIDEKKKPLLVPVTIVDCNRAEAEKVENNLKQAGIIGRFNKAVGGFSASLRTREIESYISAYKEYA
jgi:hypothetical protein